MGLTGGGVRGFLGGLRGLVAGVGGLLGGLRMMQGWCGVGPI